MYSHDYIRHSMASQQYSWRTSLQIFEIPVWQVVLSYPQTQVQLV